jgi:hypothetical protein
MVINGVTLLSSMVFVEIDLSFLAELATKGCGPTNCLQVRASRKLDARLLDNWYPLVMTNSLLLKMAIYSGFSH